MINITKTYLSSKEKYADEIYANGWVTNNGPLEKRIVAYLGFNHTIVMTEVNKSSLSAFILGKFVVSGINFLRRL